jgi:trehalose 6-phosphate synthase
METSMLTSSLVVVSSRLPIDGTVTPDGVTEWRRDNGGLVRAMHPILRDTAAAWVGWSGRVDDVSTRLPDLDGMRLHPVPLSTADYEDYYEGFANSTLWPLYHDAVEQPAHHRRWWEAYHRVNQRFAEATARVAAENAVVWVQDYHLQLVPAMLRKMRPDLRIGFFMHVSVPPGELFMQLPRRGELLEGLLGADLVGFQRPGGARNFAWLAGHLLRARNTHRGIEYDGRLIRTGAFPISINVAEVETLARNPRTIARAKQLRADLGDPARVLLAVDRLDYIKGIEQRLKVYRELLADGRIKVTDTVMVQVAVPSRQRVGHYRQLAERIEREVGRINGDFGKLGAAAVHYLNQALKPPELVALYRAADVMAVTPLRDGMNLLAKEYVAARVDGGGALVLSEFAGSAAELKHAYLVNPYDVDGTKDTFIQALEADPAEKRKRMRAMRRHVHAHDVQRWAHSYLTALTGS